MELTKLHDQLTAKQLLSFYIFTGPEWKMQDLYIEQISKVSGLGAVRADSFHDVYRKIKASQLVESSYVYVLRDDKDIMGNEDARRKLVPEVLKDNIVVLLCTAVDKRTKFYKACKSAIVEFEPLKPHILKRYLQKEAPLTDDNCNRLMKLCGYDYGRCLLEIDKIKTYGKARMQYDPNTIFHYLLNEGAIHREPYDAIFDFAAAVLDHNVNLSYDLYKQCREIGEATLVMITVLYDNAKAVLQVQSCESKDVAKTTGLLPWQIQNAEPHVGVHRNSELLYLMELLRKCESGIKKGIISEEIAVDYVLASFL